MPAVSLAKRARSSLLSLALAVAAVSALPAAASAAIPSVLAGQTIGGVAITCTAQGDGVRVCHGSSSTTPDTRFKTFDGTPLEIYVILPPAPGSGTDGNYPFIVQSHGWGGSAGGPADTQFVGPTADAWAKEGYAVLQLTARGFNDSCGSTQSRLVSAPACTNGYIRLDDDRYEIRDVQDATGLLVDEHIVDPARIGVTGESYGGGVSLQLATLKDRIMNPDGTLSPWKSPSGTPLKIAAAAPVVPWSDLVNSLMPNGRTLDYQLTSSTDDLSPIGVSKQSFVAGLYALGNTSGYYAPPLTNSEADITTWFASINAGEPYDANPQDQTILTQIARYHSAYYLLDGKYGTATEPPAPLLISNGLTDDLFPVDEALRYYNLDRARYPSNPIGLIDFDFGHMRGQNKKPDLAVLSARVDAFFNHYVKGVGATALGATVMTQTCPATAASGGPFSAATWAALHPGEVDYQSAHTAKASQSVLSTAGDASVSSAFDPVAGGGACATATATDQGSGVASYRLPAATGNGYTLMGAPTVIANLNVTGEFAYLAARLLDVDPATNKETLVARGVYRIDSNAPNGQQVFQLHPGAWHFAKGHLAKLELLGQDVPYLRKSNGQFSITVSNLELRIPVHEVPGAPGTPSSVGTPKPPVIRGACKALPKSSINRHRTRASRRGLVLVGSASEALCAQASAATRHKQKIIRVFIVAYQVRGHRCRFLQASGRLTSLRSCTRRVRLAARSTGNWVLHLKTHIAKGRYRMRSDAVDGFHHHQRPSGASVSMVTIR